MPRKQWSLRSRVLRLAKPPRQIIHGPINTMPPIQRPHDTKSGGNSAASSFTEALSPVKTIPARSASRIAVAVSWGTVGEANAYYSPEVESLTAEQLLADLHEIATEWEQELDEFFGDGD